MQKIALMDRYGWTSKQYEEENTVEDLARLSVYLEKKAVVEELERRKQEMKAKFSKH